MADTARGDFRDLICSDCGEKGCAFKHWGPLVPESQIGYFCGFCWTMRQEDYAKTKEPKPLGIQPPGIPEEFAGRNLVVKTENGRVYKLTQPDKDRGYIVSRDIGGLYFTRARVLLLVLGKGLWLKPRDGENGEPWYTSPVVSIECE